MDITNRICATCGAPVRTYSTPIGDAVLRWIGCSEDYLHRHGNTTSVPVDPEAPKNANEETKP
jgi:hypothetical protein